MKRGEESGSIKITLRGEIKEEHITIMRKMDTRNKSEWSFNGNSFQTIINIFLTSETEKDSGNFLILKPEMFSSICE